MRTLWRFGYEPPAHGVFAPLMRRRAFVGLGWRHLFWRFYWFDPAAERELLTYFAAQYGLVPYPHETSEQIRARIMNAMHMSWRRGIGESDDDFRVRIRR